MYACLGVMFYNFWLIIMRKLAISRFYSANHYKYYVTLGVKGRILYFTLFTVIYFATILRRCVNDFLATITANMINFVSIPVWLMRFPIILSFFSRLSNELAERQAEILTLKKKLKDSDFEIEQLKQQLRQYVAEVKKAEDLLTHKVCYIHMYIYNITYCNA